MKKFSVGRSKFNGLLRMRSHANPTEGTGMNTAPAASALDGRSEVQDRPLNGKQIWLDQCLV